MDAIFLYQNKKTPVKKQTDIISQQQQKSGLFSHLLERTGSLEGGKLQAVILKYKHVMYNKWAKTVALKWWVVTQKWVAGTLLVGRFFVSGRNIFFWKK